MYWRGLLSRFALRWRSATGHTVGHRKVVGRATPGDRDASMSAGVVAEAVRGPIGRFSGLSAPLRGVPVAGPGKYAPHGGAPLHPVIEAEGDRQPNELSLYLQPMGDGGAWFGSCRAHLPYSPGGAWRTDQSCSSRKPSRRSSSAKNSGMRFITPAP